MTKILNLRKFTKMLQNAPFLWTGMNAVVLRFDRQDILVLHCIFAEAGKPRLSVKPRPVGGELHLQISKLDVVASLQTGK